MLAKIKAAGAEAASKAIDAAGGAASKAKDAASKAKDVAAGSAAGKWIADKNAALKRNNSSGDLQLLEGVGAEALDGSEHLVVEVLCGTGMQYESNVVTLCASDGYGALKGRRVRLQPRAKASSPVWNAPRDLACSTEPGDVLLVEVYTSKSTFSSDLKLVAQAHVSLELLPPGGPPLAVPLRRGLDRASAGERGTGTLTLRRLEWNDAWHGRKSVFLVRHGQSKWNEAQHNRDYAKLMAFDHPLTLEGSQQATELREKWETARLEVVGATPPLIDLGEEGNRPPLDRWLKAFLSARVVLSSPLTRAVQTAVLALHKHPALDAKGLRLLRSAREVKGSMGSLDSIGKAVGSEIIVRVREKLGELMDEASVSRVMEVEVDSSDVMTEWWTTSDDQDSEAEIAERLDDLLAAVQFEQCESVIIVGHSLLWRELVRRYMSPEFREAQPEVSPNLAERKLSNGGCLGLDIDFTDHHTHIVDARLMFGSGFVA